MTHYATHFSTRRTPQSQPVPGKPMVQNSAGGYSFAVDDWKRMERFLILGNEGGSYYATEQKMTLENAAAVQRCVELDGKRAVDLIVSVSDHGRAPKNDSAIFALAMASAASDVEVRRYALAALPKVCRIGTHLFQFASSVEAFRGWGRSLKNAVAKWYLDKSPDDLAYQVVKYQQRNGWSHRDLLRLSKPSGAVGELNATLAFATGKPHGGAPSIVEAFEKAATATSKVEIIRLVREHNLPRECVPTQWLNEPDVWGALLEKMPLTAMVRNLGKMSAVGLLKPMSQECGVVASRLGDSEYIRKSRLHPLSILLAARTYGSGHGFRGSLAWGVDSSIVDALDGAFHLAFDNVISTGKRHLLALDVSGSMSARINNTSLSCRDASAAMSLITTRKEPLTHTVAFCDQLMTLDFGKTSDLQGAIGKIRRLPFGATDCALPMLYAAGDGIEVDAFVVYTDSETWFGSIHPCQALRAYREKTGIPAKLIVCGMESNGFSIADPEDAGMMDVVGFDASAPAVMAEFVRG